MTIAWPRLPARWAIGFRHPHSCSPDGNADRCRMRIRYRDPASVAPRGSRTSAAVVREHIATELDLLPGGFRRRVETTAARLAEQLRPARE